MSGSRPASRFSCNSISLPKGNIPKAFIGKLYAVTLIGSMIILNYLRGKLDISFYSQHETLFLFSLVFCLRRRSLPFLPSIFKLTLYPENLRKSASPKSERATR